MLFPVMGVAEPAGRAPAVILGKFPIPEGMAVDILFRLAIGPEVGVMLGAVHFSSSG